MGEKKKENENMPNTKTKIVIKLPIHGERAAQASSPLSIPYRPMTRGYDLLREGQLLLPLYNHTR